MVTTRGGVDTASPARPSPSKTKKASSKSAPGSTSWGKLFLSVRHRGSCFALVLSVYAIVLIVGSLRLYDEYRQRRQGSSIPQDGMRSKLSFTVFPAVVVSAAALLVFSTIPPLAVADRTDLVSANGTMSTVRKLQERANVSRLITNVFAVLFLWRMSTFYPKIHSDDGDSLVWFQYSMVVGGLGLVVGLINTYLYSELSKAAQAMRKQYRITFVEK